MLQATRSRRKIMRTLQRTTVVTIVLLLSTGGTANALQTHGAPEGIYVHQMAHVLFSGALLYLYLHTRKTQETSGKGWKFFQIFCLFLIGWNILAFTGHYAYEHLSDADFLFRNSLAVKLTFPVTPKKIIFYLTKMDHFLIVPALIALVISLRAFYVKVKKEADQ